MRRYIILCFLVLALLFINLIDEGADQAEFATNIPEQVDQASAKPSNTGEQVKTKSEDPYAIALSAFRKENFYKAEEYFEQVTSENPHYREAVVYLKKTRILIADNLLVEGRAKLQQGDLKEALALLEEALSYNPDLKEALQLKASALQRYEAEARHDFKKTMAVMEGEGDIAVAVDEVKIKKSTGQHQTSGIYVYLHVLVRVNNSGNQLNRIIPNNFTLAAVDGSMSSIDYDTYSIPDYLKPTDLKEGETVSGWLIFHTVEGKEYVLNYNGYDETISKKIVP